MTSVAHRPLVKPKGLGNEHSPAPAQLRDEELDLQIELRPSPIGAERACHIKPRSLATLTRA